MNCRLTLYQWSKEKNRCAYGTEKNYDGIVFDIWYVFTTLGMFLGVILGYATTLWVKMG